MFIDRDRVKVHKHASWLNIQPSWLNKRGQYRIYYMEKEQCFFRDKTGNPIAWVTNRSLGFSLSFLLMELAM